MNKKVYFAGSIRGGRADAGLYRRIIDYIQETDDVLTEHVGDVSYTSLESEDGAADRRIYAQDMAWMHECDFVVAECTCVSTGVGYELAYAEKLGKPVHIFYRPKDANLSAMICGNPYFSIIRYENWDDLEPKLKEVLENA